jgi:hypothetical protein
MASIEDPDFYARDDGTTVPASKCTREELLLALRQIHSTIRSQDNLIRLLQGDAEKMEKRLMREIGEMLIKKAGD